MNPANVIRPGKLAGVALLKLAVIYGANASGKSNLVKGMSLARELIRHAPEANGAVPIIPFKLDAEFRRKPSRFEFEMKIGDRYFAYGFAATFERVIGGMALRSGTRYGTLDLRALKG